MTKTSTTKAVSQVSWYQPLRYLSVFGLVFGLDQGSKSLADSSVLNTGISFSLLQSWWLLPVFLLIFWLLGWLITYRWFFVRWWVHAAFWGAALSNLVDRFVWGGVRDIWPIPFVPLKNNVADWILVIMTLCWVWYLYREEQYDK